MLSSGKLAKSIASSVLPRLRFVYGGVNSVSQNHGPRIHKATLHSSRLQCSNYKGMLRHRIKPLKLICQIDVAALGSVMVVLVFTLMIWETFTHSPHHGVAVDLPKVAALFLCRQHLRAFDDDDSLHSRRLMQCAHIAVDSGDIKNTTECLAWL